MPCHQPPHRHQAPPATAARCRPVTRISKKKNNLRSRDFFSPCHDAFDYFVGILLKNFFPVLRPVPAARFKDLEEPDRIIRTKFLNQYFQPLLLDLAQCSGAHLVFLLYPSDRIFYAYVDVPVGLKKYYQAIIRGKEDRSGAFCTCDMQ